MRYATERDYDDPDEDELFCYSQGFKHGKLGLEHYAGHSNSYDFKRAYNIGFQAGCRARERQEQGGNHETR